MKAIALNSHGGPDKLEYTDNFPVPEILDDEILVRNVCTSVNRVDLVIRSGYPGLALNFPHVLGGDITGIVEKTGSSVKGFRQGDRVISWPLAVKSDDEFVRKGRASLSPSWKYFGMHVNGSYAEYTAVPESSLLHLPDNVSYEHAACMPVAGLTSYHAVHTVAELKKSDSFFIWGGTGGFGVIAVQLALALGAEVFATAGSQEKIDLLKSLGVHHIFNHKEDADIPGKVMKITNGLGLDCILDYVGPATYEQSFRMLKKGGKLLWCGILTGRETNVSIHMTYLRHLSILGLYLGEKNELEELIKLLSEGKIKPVIHSVLPLDQASNAHNLIAEGKITGKVILKP